VASIDSDGAREQLEMVERILAQSAQRLCAGGEFFAVWGIYSGIATIAGQLVDDRLAPASLFWFQLAALAAAVLFTVWRSRHYRGSSRMSLVQREYFRVLWLSLGLALVANLAAFNVFSGWAQSAVWTFAEIIVLLFIGTHRNVRATVAGIVMIASLIAANFAGNDAAGFVLGAGMILGYAGFGFAELLARE
jgi:hypothetical protein